MKFVDGPNLPGGAVRLAVVDGRLSTRAESKLKGMGVGIVKVRPHPALYDAVSAHPDMLLHHIGGKVIIYAPGTDPEAVECLAGYGFDMVRGTSMLKPSYPFDIAYNVARVGRWYFHNLKYTDRCIKEYMDRAGAEPVHISQGYAKCSIMPVDGNSIITADAGITRVARERGIDVLHLDCSDSIRLPGLDHGFIGGACGMLSPSMCVINGSLRKLKGYEAMVSFLSERNISITEISNDCVTDIGSIIPIMIDDHSN